MAAKKKDTAPAPEDVTIQEEGKAQEPENQGTQDENSQTTEQQGIQQEPAAQTQAETEAEALPSQPDSDKLLSLEALATEFRVAGWQHAAVLRLMGWEKGKLVSREQYENALDSLAHRRQGGGRR